MDYKIVKYDAVEHSELVSSIPAENELKPFNIFRHFNPNGKRIVDMGCGDGSISRIAIDRGSEYVFGIDSKNEMIKLAEELNKDYWGRISYYQAFVEKCKGNENFDIAIMSYFLNNAETENQLERQVESAFSFLKKGGKAIVFNNNPFDTIGGDFTKYGFRKIISGVREGDEIMFNYSPAITDTIVNYFISPKAHEEAFRKAGFSKFKWEKVGLMPGADMEFWKEYFNRKELPVIGIVAEK